MAEERFHIRKIDGFVGIVEHSDNSDLSTILANFVIGESKSVLTNVP